MGKTVQLLLIHFQKWITPYWLIRVNHDGFCIIDFIEQRSPHGSCDRKYFKGSCHFSYEYIFSIQNSHENVPHWPYFLDYRHRKRRRKNRFVCSIFLSLSPSLAHTTNQISNSFLINFLRWGEEKNEKEKKPLSIWHWRSFKYVICEMTSIWWECLLNK